MAFSVNANIIPTSYEYEDTKNMIFVKDNDPIYPSFFTSSTDDRSLTPSKEIPLKQHFVSASDATHATEEQQNDNDNDNSTSISNSLNSNNIDLKMATTCTRRKDHVSFQNQQQIDQLDIGTTTNIPTIQETLATPIEKHNLAPPNSSRLPSWTPSYHPPQGNLQQQCQVATIPVIQETATAKHIPKHKDTILKTGRLLCSKSFIWYTSRQQRRLYGQGHSASTGQHRRQQRQVQRQETRLGWREFRAVLKPHCLELYLVSPLLLRGPRLAHIIYFSYHTKHSSSATSFSKTPWHTPLSSRRHQKQRHLQRRHQSIFQPQKVSTAKLSIASLADYTLRLEYQNKTRGTTTFLFNAPTVSASQSWYMALYKQIPLKTTHATHTPSYVAENQHLQQNSSKKPIPLWIDVMIPCLQAGSTSGSSTNFIRVPLDSVVDQNAFCIIRASDLKHCLFKMLNDSSIDIGWNHHLLTPDMMSLCWRYGPRIEWIPDSASLIGPQLIEKEHVLELRSISPMNKQVLESPVTMEGFLIQSTNENGEFKLKHQTTRMYALTEGHYLFLIDPSKAVLPNQQENRKNGWSLNWLSAATLMNLHPRRYGNGKQRQQRQQQPGGNYHFFQSVPGFFGKNQTSSHGNVTRTSLFFRHKKETSSGSNSKGTNTRRQHGDNSASSQTDDVQDENVDNTGQQEEARIADMVRRAGQVGYAYAVIDLSYVSRVQPVRVRNKNKNDDSESPSRNISRTTTATPTSPFTFQPRSLSALSSSSSSAQLLKNELSKRQKRLFEIIMDDPDDTRIQFEATSAQAMFEWVQRLRRCVKYGNECRSKGIVLSQAITSLWYRNIHKIILQSGILYVRKNSQKTYRRYLCVLSRGHGLLLYRHNRHGMMTKRRTIKLQQQKGTNNTNKSTYVYAMDHAMDLKVNDAPTNVMTADGVRTRNEIHQCAFVVWQRYSLSKNHWVAQIKEHASLLKLGHRLGRKGYSFIFLASSIEEKEAWVWALQRELEY
ncbi:hypothetical protein BCR42DRAFT_408042 [Absidia repens]|uniref:PH domain-containing protein n=1 Tax=Absidia repens TaxID=90262 RepID=A0A1X2IT26_9FUNG|nr:hypothetical protein BCR42DRAFT_408042 [Absidia repens]